MPCFWRFGHGNSVVHLENGYLQRACLSCILTANPGNPDEQKNRTMTDITNNKTPDSISDQDMKQWEEQKYTELPHLAEQDLKLTMEEMTGDPDFPLMKLSFIPVSEKPATLKPTSSKGATRANSSCLPIATNLKATIYRNLKPFCLIGFTGKLSPNRNGKPAQRKSVR